MGNFDRVTNPGKKVNFRSQFSYQNATLLSFMLMESFYFLQEFKIPFEIRFTTFKRKCQNIQKTNHSEQKLVTLFNLVYLLILMATDNHKLVCLSFSFGKLQTQK